MSTDYGRDTSCTDSLQTGRFVTGVRLVGQACYRRLTTPRGMLRGGEDEDNYGLDISELIGSGNPKSVAATLPGRISAELSKDERIESVEVEVLVTKDGPETNLSVTVKCQTGAGPFTLVLLASAVTVELLGIEDS